MRRPSTSETQVIIAPSLLAADFGFFQRETERVARSDAEWLHLDIMDGHFVPNLSFGPDVVEALRPRSSLFFDVHLMCSKPDILLQPFAIAGADAITIHVELGRRVEDLIWQIRSLKKNVGLAVNPTTSIDSVPAPWKSTTQDLEGSLSSKKHCPKSSKPTDGNKNRVCLFVFKWMAASTKEPVVFALKKVRTHL